MLLMSTIDMEVFQTIITQHAQHMIIHIPSLCDDQHVLLHDIDDIICDMCTRSSVYLKKYYSFKSYDANQSNIIRTVIQYMLTLARNDDRRKDVHELACLSILLAENEKTNDDDDSHIANPFVLKQIHRVRIMNRVVRELDEILAPIRKDSDDTAFGYMVFASMLWDTIVRCIHFRRKLTPSERGDDCVCMKTGGYVAYMDQRISGYLQRRTFSPVVDAVVAVPALLFGTFGVPFTITLFCVAFGWHRLAHVIASALLTLCVTQWSKRYFGRLRPRMYAIGSRYWNIRGRLANPAFPSGDSAQAGVIATAVVLATNDLRWYTMITTAMFGRIYYGAHWLGDTIAGAIVGVVCTHVCAWLLTHFSHNTFGF